MPTWLLIIVVGAILLVVGVAVEAARILIWIGVAVLVVGLILNLARRGRSRV
jgi:membrane-bound ClpP family serine protease